MLSSRCAGRSRGLSHKWGDPIPSTADQFRQMLAKLAALKTVHNWIHAGVEHDQSRGDCVMNSNERDGASEAQEIDQQLRNPTQDVDDRHENNHLGDAFPVALQSFLGFLPDVILSEPKVVNHSGVEDSHNAYGDETCHHRPPNRVEVPVDRLGPTVAATLELLEVCNSNETGNGPKEGKRPAGGYQDCNLGFCEFSFMAVWIQHGAIALDCNCHKRKHGCKRADPTNVSTSEHLAKNVPTFPLGVGEGRSDDERYPNEHCDNHIRGC